jgi:hypothetical protein
MNLKFKEVELLPEGFIKFLFNVTDEEKLELIRRVPIEVYAFRMIVGSEDFETK